MATDVANLTLQFDSASAKTASTDMDKMLASGQGVGGMVELLQGKFAALMTVLGPAALGVTFALAIKSAIELEASYVRLAQIAGTTSANISGLALPAALAGTSLEAMASAMGKLNREVGLAKLGDFGNKSQLLRAIGIDPGAGDDPADILLKVAQALVGMKDPTIAAKVAFDLLGRSYAELKPALIELINQGGIHARTTVAQNQAAKDLADNWVRVKTAMEDSAIAMANKTVPTLDNVLAAILRVKAQTGSFLGLLLNPDALEAAGGSITGTKPQGSQADVRALDNAQLGGGLATNTGPSAEERRVKQLLDDQKQFAARLSLLKASGAAYTEAIKTDLALQDLAYKEAGATSLRAQEELIKQKQVLNDADLVMQAQDMEAERKLQLGKDPLDQSGKAADAANAIALINQKRVNDERVTQATIQALRATTQMQELAQAQALIASHEQAGEAVADSLLTVREAEMKSFKQRQTDLDIFIASGKISREQAITQQERLETDHQAKMGSIQAQGRMEALAFDAMTYDQQASYLANFGATATQTAAAHNKKMFDLNKIFGEAQIIISTTIGVMKAWEMGPILGPIMAALVGAAGAINLQTLRSTSYGGGGGIAPSIGAAAGGATPVVNVPSTPAGNAPAGGTTIVNIQGNFIGTREFMDTVVIPAIQDATNNKDVILFNPNSRQAAVQPGVGVS